MNIYSLGMGGPSSGDRPGLEIVQRRLGLPGIKCVGEPGCCGETWADAAARLPVEPPAGTRQPYKHGPVVDPATFKQLQLEIRDLLSLPETLPLPPGLRCGHHHLKLTGRTVMSFEWPVGGDPVVRNDVLLALEDSGLTGWKPFPAVITKRRAGRDLPSVTELVVTGRAGKAISDPPLERVSMCSVCFREVFRKTCYRDLAVDPSIWDGSDIFRFDPPFSGHLFVTQRWVESLAPYRFDGFAYQSVQELLETRRRVTI